MDLSLVATLSATANLSSAVAISVSVSAGTATPNLNLKIGGAIFEQVQASGVTSAQIQTKAANKQSVSISVIATAAADAKTGYSFSALTQADIAGSINLSIAQNLQPVAIASAETRNVIVQTAPSYSFVASVGVVSSVNDIETKAANKKIVTAGADINANNVDVTALGGSTSVTQQVQASVIASAPDTAFRVNITLEGASATASIPEITQAVGLTMDQAGSTALAQNVSISALVDESIFLLVQATSEATAQNVKVDRGFATFSLQQIPPADPESGNFSLQELSIYYKPIEQQPNSQTVLASASAIAQDVTVTALTASGLVVDVQASMTALPQDLTIDRGFGTFNLQQIAPQNPTNGDFALKVLSPDSMDFSRTIVKTINAGVGTAAQDVIFSSPTSATVTALTTTSTNNLIIQVGRGAFSLKQTIPQDPENGNFVLEELYEF